MHSNYSVHHPIQPKLFGFNTKTEFEFNKQRDVHFRYYKYKGLFTLFNQAQVMQKDFASVTIVVTRLKTQPMKTLVTCVWDRYRYMKFCRNVCAVPLIVFGSINCSDVENVRTI